MSTDESKFLNYFKECRNKGMTESEIARSLGMTVVELRRTRREYLRNQRDQKKEAPA